MANYPETFTYLSRHMLALRDSVGELYDLSHDLAQRLAAEEHPAAYQAREVEEQVERLWLILIVMTFPDDFPEQPPSGLSGRSD